MSLYCLNFVIQEFINLVYIEVRMYNCFGRKLEFFFDQEWIKVFFLESMFIMVFCLELGLCRCDLVGFERYNNRKYWCNWSYFIQLYRMSF